jgi:hypothetical protein
MEGRFEADCLSTNKEINEQEQKWMKGEQCHHQTVKLDVVVFQ